MVIYMKTKYVLITPAHNEEKYIAKVIESVISQTIGPMRWLIVDDSSTDRTLEIIRRYEAQYDFITSLKLERKDIVSYYSQRTLGFLAGYEKIKNLEYDFIGSLDADISFEPTYYEEILEEFDKNPQLGVASGVYVDKIADRLQRILIDKMHCPGAIAVFRRQCYEMIGGYIPQKHGGDDTCAEIMARMNGWETRSFPQYQAIHFRPTGTGDGKSILQARFRQGLTEYGIATHPLFMAAKSFRRVFLEKPYFVGSIARFVGFLYAYCLRNERQLSHEVMRFVRKEQIRRLWACIRKNQR